MTNRSPATVLHTDTGCNPEAVFSIKPRVISLVEVGTNQLYLAAIVLTAVVKWSKNVDTPYLMIKSMNLGCDWMMLTVSTKVCMTVFQLYLNLVNNFPSYSFPSLNVLTAYTATGFNPCHCESDTPCGAKTILFHIYRAIPYRGKHLDWSVLCSFLGKCCIQFGFLSTAIVTYVDQTEGEADSKPCSTAHLINQSTVALHL